MAWQVVCLRSSVTVRVSLLICRYHTTIEQYRGRTSFFISLGSSFATTLFHDIHTCAISRLVPTSKTSTWRSVTNEHAKVKVWGRFICKKTRCRIFENRSTAHGVMEIFGDGAYIYMYVANFSPTPRLPPLFWTLLLFTVHGFDCFSVPHPSCPPARFSQLVFSLVLHWPFCAAA